jgi:ER-bound oxygenase mpaB/B'/Rubber oxygenase, catalytic domain
MGAGRWTDETLDAMRAVGDPVADPAVAALFADGGVDAVNDLLGALVFNDGIPAAGLPKVVSGYLDKTAAVPALDSEKVERGEAMFGVVGPEILMALGFYGLPADYAARKGVQVLHRTGLLGNTPIRRVFETTQMVVDVMAEGGLRPSGRGVRTAQKVRLMHAAVRHLITHDRERPWDPSLGVPINQEDLAGTLMTFGYVVLDGLDRLSVHVGDDDREAYFHAWQAVGRLMGVREELIPANVAEGRRLTEIIHARQIAPSPEGRELTRALVHGYEKLLPAHLAGVPASLIHFFLDRDPFTGQNVAEMLGVPPGDWTEHVTRLVVHVDAFLTRRGIENPVADRVLAYVNRQMIEGMLLVERGGRRAPFYIPDELQAQWGIAPRAPAR